MGSAQAKTAAPSMNQVKLEARETNTGAGHVITSQKKFHSGKSARPISGKWAGGNQRQQRKRWSQCPWTRPAKNKR